CRPVEHDRLVGSRRRRGRREVRGRVGGGRVQDDRVVRRVAVVPARAARVPVADVHGLRAVARGQGVQGGRGVGLLRSPGGPVVRELEADGGGGRGQRQGHLRLGRVSGGGRDRDRAVRT